MSENKLRDAAASAVAAMRERYQQRFHKDEKGMPRIWAPSVDIPKCSRVAKLAAARVLAQLAISQVGLEGV